MGKLLTSQTGDSGPGLDQVLAALAHGVRRSIIDRLRYGPASAGELAEPHAMSLPAISRHLRVLEEAHLVIRRVQGRIHNFELAPATLQRVDDWLEHYRSFWTESLDSLARHFEDGLETPDPGARKSQRSRRRR